MAEGDENGNVAECCRNIAECSNSAIPDDTEECLLCLMKFLPSDSRFRSCKCSFKICRFCWYRLVISENPNCPMCRTKYFKKKLISKLGTSIIPRLEAVRQIPEIGEKAFDLINLFSYLNPTFSIPTEIFNDTPKVMDLLDAHDLIRLSPSKSKMNLGKFVRQSDVRRCADKEKMINLAMEYLLCVLNPEIEASQWGHKSRSVRFELLKAYLPHALALWNHILNFDEKILIPGSPSFFACLCDRLDQTGFYSQLNMVTQKSVHRYYSTFGPWHLNTLRIQADLATSEWRLGRLDKAMDILTRILPTARNFLGREHWLTMNVNNELAFILNGKGLLEQALEVSNEVCRISLKLHGENHRDTLTVNRNKGILLLKMENYAGALDIFYSTYKTQRETFGALNLATINTQFWIGQVLISQGHLQESLRVITDVFEKQQKLVERDENAILRGASILAFVLNELEEFEKVVTFCSEQSERLRCLEPPSDTDQVISRLVELVKLETELAKGYLGLGKPKTAKTILIAVDEIQTKYKGKNGFNTKETKTLIELCDSDRAAKKGKVWES